MPGKTATHAGEKDSTAVRRPQDSRALRSQAEPGYAARAFARAISGSHGTLVSADILALQRAAGNRAVQQIFETALGQAGGSSAVHSQALIQRSGDLHKPAAGRVTSRKIHQPHALPLPPSTSVNVIQRKEDEELLKRNGRGLPDTLKSGVENLSGMSMDDVKVHYNSPKPAALQALAYTQGTGIHLRDAEEEEEQIPHEAWHNRLTIQRKLALGPARDRYEREADRIAATVMQAPGPSVPAIQRERTPEEETIQAKPSTCCITPLIQRQETPEAEETTIQMCSEGGLAGVQPRVEGDIASVRGGGDSLPRDVRFRMERALGADFSQVRVHTGPKADNLARALKSRAFTTGRDIFFKSGEYNPASHRGQKLIAHELTHVVQQSGGRSGRPGLSIQRASDAVIQRNPIETIQSDREAWKLLPTSTQAALTVAAPIWGAVAGGPKALYDFYKARAGDSTFSQLCSGFATAILSPLIISYGAVTGALRGLAYGIGNPLYSTGQWAGGKMAAAASSIGRGAAAGAEWIGTKVNEGRGIYNVDVTGKYGNLDGGVRRENYNQTTGGDIANYAALLGSAGSSAGAVATQYGSLAKWDKPITDTVPLLGESGKAISGLGIGSSALGAVTSLAEARQGYAEWKDSARSKEQQRIGAGRAISGVAGAAQQSATTAFHIGNLTQTGVAAGAQIAAGGAAIATGAADIVRGGYAGFKAHQNVARLRGLQERYDTTPRLQTPAGADIVKAARQGASTQEMRRSVGVGTALKGGLTAAGGIMLAASLATPIGWALLGAGAVIGGLFAIKRYLNKRKRKEEVAMRELKVSKTEREYWEKDVEKIKKETGWRSQERKDRLEALGPEPLERELKRFGFKDAGHFYANYINYMANHVYDEGTRGRVVFVSDALESIDHQRRRGQLTREWRNREESLRREVKEADLDKMSYKEIEQALRRESITLTMEGNHYPEVEELLQGIGLRFDWTKKPPQPTPDKIGKALDE